MHLFLVVLGGRSRGCHIELHDVRFVAGHRIDDTLPALRQQWFGRRQGLHIDSWLHVESVEGWRVALRPQPSTEPQRLWFVNLGAYDPRSPAELHDFGLFVAPSATAAAARAKRHLLVGALQRHKDDLHELETARPGPSLQGAAPPQAATEAIRPAVEMGSGQPAVAQAPLPGAPSLDDVLAVDQLGDWGVHLLPPEPGADTRWRPLRPDWFGYWRIDRAEPD